MPYDLTEHRHRFAVWAAARAASRGGRFGTPTEMAFRWIETLGLQELVADPALLPDPNMFDEQHRAWRTRLVETAGAGCSHGKAAKLINVYLKAAVVCACPAQAGEPVRRAVGAIHPPIDRFLLNAWGIAGVVWSSLDSNDYEKIIETLKMLAPSPNQFLEFWRLEERWTGTL